MKERTKRFLASLLAALIVLAPLSAPAYADEAGTDIDATPAVTPQDTENSNTENSNNENSNSENSNIENSNIENSNTENSNIENNNNENSNSENSNSENSNSENSNNENSNSENSNSENSNSENSNSENSNTENSNTENNNNENSNTENSNIENNSNENKIAALSEGEESTSSSVSIGDKDLADTANASAGWDAVSNSGWRYDSASQSVSMVNNGSAVDVHAEGTGIDLNVAGFNRIGTLYADRDVNITGTGIVLIDSIDMLEGANLNLLTNIDVYADGTGSAAVFKKTGEGEYTLINGSRVAGILDEEYTIPEGITLVVPDDSTLEMRVTTQVTTTTTTETSSSAGTSTSTVTETHYGFTAEDNDKMILFEREQTTGSIEGGTEKTTTVKKEASFFTPVLNIAAQAALKIQEGAKLLMQSFQSFFKDPQYSTLNVSGKLELGGEIKAYANENDGSAQDFVLNVESGGQITGKGTMTDAAIFYKEGAGSQDQLNLAGSNYVTVDSNGISSLNSAGTTSVIYADGVSMGSVSAGVSGSVTFYGKSADSQLNVSGSVTGNYTISSGYLTIGGHFANDDFTGITPETGFILYGGNGSIPGSAYPPKLFFDGYVSDSNTSQYFNAGAYQELPSAAFPDSISFNSLSEIIKNGDQSFEYYEVYTRDSQGKVTLHLLSKTSTETVEKTQVFLIRGIRIVLAPINEAGSGITSTGTGNTGSGILGGENAGSLSGGNPNSVLNGNRLPPSPPVVPDPKPEGGGSGSGGTEGGGSGSGSTEGGGSGSGSTGSGSTEGGSTEGGGSGSGSTGNGSTEGGSTEGGGSGSGSTGNGSTEGGSTEGGGSGSGSTGNGSGAFFSNAGTNHTYTVKVSDTGADYRVDAFLDGVSLQQLDGGTVHVEMAVQLEDGWNEHDLFAVFYNDKGELVAVKASYDPATGTLVFESPLLGQFQLVCFPWEGTDYESPAFLVALQACMS